MKIELPTDYDRRFLAGKPTVEKRADGEQEFANIEGYAAVFFDERDTEKTQYDIFGDERVFERIMPGAFDRAMKEADDVRALFNHNPDLILGRTPGTLKLSVDRRGLFYVIDVPETQLGKQVTVSVERGDVTGSSFAFRVDDQSFRELDGGKILIREVNSVSLFDVGPVTFPAYSGSSAGLSKRSLGAIEAFRSKTASRRECAKRRLSLLQLAEQR